MDARSIALEMAPVIMWQKERKPELCREYWNPASKSAPAKKTDPTPTYSAWDMLAEEGEGVDASSPIPLDDGVLSDFGAIEVEHCLVEHHNAIFTDVNETVWR